MMKRQSCPLVLQQQSFGLIKHQDVGSCPHPASRGGSLTTPACPEGTTHARAPTPSVLTLQLLEEESHLINLRRQVQIAVAWLRLHQP